MKFERSVDPLDEILLFSVHKCYVVIWRHDVMSFESLETVAMQGYFIFIFVYFKFLEDMSPFRGVTQGYIWKYKGGGSRILHWRGRQPL